MVLFKVYRRDFLTKGEGYRIRAKGALNVADITIRESEQGHLEELSQVGFKRNQLIQLFNH